MNQKDPILCACGNEMKQAVNSFTHSIFQKQIVLHNVPHTYCPTCGKNDYDNEETVVRLLREAYLRQDEQAYYQ